MKIRSGAMILAAGFLFGSNVCSHPEAVSDRVWPENDNKAIAEMTGRDFNLAFGHFQPDSLPEMPDMIENNATLEGIDSNSNNVRDDVEVVAYQTVSFLPETGKADYEELLGVLRMLNPDSKVTSEKAIYCAYDALHEAIKDDMSLGLMYRFALNTKARRGAYAEKLRAS